MDKNDAIEFLKQYNIIQKSCDIIDEQMFDISSLKRELKREENIPAGEKTEKGFFRAEKYLSGLSDEYRNLSMRKRLLIRRLKLIESVVKTLPKNERKVIERFFLSPDKHRAADELIEELEFEKTQIYRLRTHALEMIANLIDNIPLTNDAN